MMYVCTVQIALEADNPAEAADGISACLSENLQSSGAIYDWGYLSVGGQYLYPTEVVGELACPPFERGVAAGNYDGESSK